MSSRAKVRTARGWDIAVVAAIVAVLLLGWLTSFGAGGGAPPRSGQLVVPAPLSARPGPGRGVTGYGYVAPWPLRGDGGAAAQGRGTRR
jgi:hypothetical protein